MRWDFIGDKVYCEKEGGYCNACNFTNRFANCDEVERRDGEIHRIRSKAGESFGAKIYKLGIEAIISSLPMNPRSLLMAYVK